MNDILCLLRYFYILLTVKICLIHQPLLYPVSVNPGNGVTEQNGVYTVKSLHRSQQTPQRLCQVTLGPISRGHPPRPSPFYPPWELTTTKGPLPSVTDCVQEGSDERRYHLGLEILVYALAFKERKSRKPGASVIDPM